MGHVGGGKMRSKTAGFGAGGENKKEEKQEGAASD